MTPLVRDNPDYADAQAFYALLTFESSNRTGGDIPWITAEARSRKALERALSLNPELAEAYLVKGHLAERSHDIDLAISMYEKAIEINPSYSDAYVSLAEASMAAQQPDRAWEALNLSRTLDPVSPYVLETVARIATLYDRPGMAEESMNVLWRVAPETASLLQSTLYLDRGDAARALIQLEHHLAQFPDADHMDIRLAYAYARLGMKEKAAELSPRVKMIIAANDGEKELALRLAGELAAGLSDPHDRADEYWMPYYSLGMYDEALTVLSDLWYGYAEEQMGPRMDSLDCYILAALLLREGRQEEAAPLIELLQKEAPIGLDRWANQMANASLRLLNGDPDSAMRILQDLADEKHFSQFFGTPYWQFLGLRDHPDYPALVAKFFAWQQEQYQAYLKLKAAEQP